MTVQIKMYKIKVKIIHQKECWRTGTKLLLDFYYFLLKNKYYISKLEKTQKK